jgi:hypothetical protein
MAKPAKMTVAATAETSCVVTLVFTFNLRIGWFSGETAHLGEIA